MCTGSLYPISWVSAMQRHDVIVIARLKIDAEHGSRVRLNSLPVNADGAWQEVLARLDVGLQHERSNPVRAIAVLQAALALGLKLPRTSARRHHAIVRANACLSFAFVARGRKFINRGVKHLEKMVMHYIQLGMVRGACISSGRVISLLPTKGETSRATQVAEWTLDALAPHQAGHEKELCMLRSLLGDAYSQACDLPHAITTYEEALALNGENVATLGNLGETLRKAGEYGRAAEQFERALSLAANNPPLRRNLLESLAAVYNAIGDVENDRRCTREAQELASDPFQSETHSYLGSWRTIDEAQERLHEGRLTKKERQM